ncbi:MAG: glycosyltransferase family 2 protein [bacterium]
MKLSVIIPVYNEESSVSTVIETVLAQPLPGKIEKEIIVVNDGSTDLSAENVQKYTSNREVRLISHDKNLGKGAAIRTGIKQAEGDLIIFQDADLEYNPADYPAMMEPFLKNNADVVYGSRFLCKKNLFFSPANRFANKFLTTLSNFLSSMKVTDMETCYKAMRRETIEKITLKENRFGIEPEITAKIAAIYRRKKLRFTEIPISYNPRTYREGKKIRFSDGLKAIGAIVKYNLFCPHISKEDFK